MAYWILMLSFCLLIPIAMIAFGSRFAKKPPKKINMVYGYRTGMSMKNRDTWEFAHRHCGRLWRIIGLILLLLSIAALLATIGREQDVINICGSVVYATQLLCMIGSIFPTEIALRKNFNKDGNRYAPNHLENK